MNKHIEKLARGYATMDMVDGLGILVLFPAGSAFLTHIITQAVGYDKNIAPAVGIGALFLLVILNGVLGVLSDKLDAAPKPPKVVTVQTYFKEQDLLKLMQEYEIPADKLTELQKNLYKATKKKEEEVLLDALVNTAQGQNSSS